MKQLVEQPAESVVKGIGSTSLAWAVRRDWPGAMERLVEEYQDRLYGYALRLLKDPFDAQEVTQDALVKAHQCFAFEYDDERCRQLQLTPWLFRVARNLSLNRLRSRRRLPEPVDNPDIEPDQRQAGAATDPGTRLENLEDRAALEKAMSRLDEEDRDLIALRFVEGMSYQQIVAVTGGSEAGARGKLFRALKKLRVILSEE